MVTYDRRAGAVLLFFGICAISWGFYIAFLVLAHASAVHMFLGLILCFLVISVGAWLAVMAVTRSDLIREKDRVREITARMVWICIPTLVMVGWLVAIYPSEEDLWFPLVAAITSAALACVLVNLALKLTK